MECPLVRRVAALTTSGSGLVPRFDPPVREDELTCTNPTESCFQLGPDGKTMQIVEKAVKLPDVRIGSDLYWRLLKGGWIGKGGGLPRHVWASHGVPGLLAR